MPKNSDKQLIDFLTQHRANIRPTLRGYRQQLFEQFQQAFPNSGVSWNHFSYILRGFITDNSIEASSIPLRTEFMEFLDAHSDLANSEKQGSGSQIKQQFDKPELTNTRLYKWLHQWRVQHPKTTTAEQTTEETTNQQSSA